MIAMINIVDKTKCCGCTGCVATCPTGAIKMAPDEKGFLYPQIDNSLCVNCSACERVCPIINKEHFQNEPKAYAAYNKDESVRLKSSSGGIFTLLADIILDKGGVIFGAAYDEDFKIKHISIESKDELYKLRTSKYLQSYIGDSYLKCKKLLLDNRYVLFTGTPCQVNGLYEFLGKNNHFERLYTHDIICHGVPSPKLWEKYKEYRKRVDQESTITGVNFRDKDSKWSNFSLKIDYENGKSYSKPHPKDIYMNAFLRDAALRDSCYSCTFKDRNRISDITLGDFWGINNIYPELNDEKGISVLIVHSKKGEEIFENIKEKIVYKEVEFELSIQANKSMYQSVPKPDKREEFFENMDKLEFDKLVNLYTVKQAYEQ